MTLDEIFAHKALRGVAIGCVAGEDLRASKDAVAHAHWRKGKSKGWICLASRRHLNRTTLIHELAHLILGQDAHGEEWRRMVRQLGGRVERNYLRRSP